ncbi:MAG TPA: dTDP-4-dehydrorhamnose reductase [Blastocatellia bacterium]|nr:dTDP-4-dehydrorhamnose reductase [Blastocatellia bacterium]
MKVLITGAGGQLGHALSAALVRHELVPLTHSQLDITNLSEVRAAVGHHRPDLVINAAAYTNVDGAEDDQEGAYRLNALGPRNLALATADSNLPLVQVSTDYVFDGLGGRPYHEFDEPRPLAIYGRSKLAGEQAVASLNARHYIVRTAWLYHTEPAAGRNFPKTMIALSARDEVRVVNDQHGSPTYAPHLAAALAQLMETGAYGIYHLAGNGGTTWFELTRRLYQLLDIRTPVHPVTTAEFPRPARRPPYSVLTTLHDSSFLLPSWEAGLAAYALEVKRRNRD